MQYDAWILIEWSFYSLYKYFFSVVVKQNQLEYKKVNQIAASVGHQFLFQDKIDISTWTR